MPIYINDCQNNRLRVVSNFGDGDCGAGEIHTRARARNFEATRREGSTENCIFAIAKIRDYSQSIKMTTAGTDQTT